MYRTPEEIQRESREELVHAIFCAFLIAMKKAEAKNK